MRALITGVSGFVGPYLTQLLVSKNIKVFGIARSNFSFQEKMVYYKVDLLDKNTTKKAVTEINPDYIFHLAGISSVKQSWDDPELTYKINVGGTDNLISSIPKASCTKILFVSTAEVYGIPKEVPITEKHKVNPQNPYGKSKLEAEKIVEESGFDYIISRSFQHIGPRQRLGFVCPDFAKQIIDIEKGKQKPIMYVGNLEAKRDFTDVRDVVQAYYLAMTKGTYGEIYNICSGKSYLIKDILNSFLAISKIKIEVKQDPEKMRPIKIPVQVGDNSKFVKQTGWQPKISIKESLKDIMDYWRKKV